MVFVTDSNATPIVGTNSYVTAEQVVGYSQSHNLAQSPITVTSVVPFIFRAMDYIESHRDDFKGRKTLGTQALQWPRVGVVIDGFSIAENVIPDELKEALSVCAIEFVNGYDPNRPLRPQQDAKTSRGLSVISSSVSERYLVDWGLADVLPRVEALLRPLLRDNIDEITLSL